MKERTSADHLVYADALRTAAILLVVINHLMWFARPSIGSHAWTFGYFGIWGVNCFFVLSGFLLGRSYLKALIDDTPLPSMKLFYFRRFLRIYPAYFVAVIASLIAAVLFLHVRPGALDIVYHFFFGQAFSTDTVISLNAPLWTMGIDVAFYLALPIAALAFRALVRKRTRTERIGAIVVSLAAVSLLCVAFRAVAYTVHPTASYDFPVALVFVRNPFGFACSFMLGLGVALIALTRPRANRSVAIAIGSLGLVLAVTEFATRFEASGDGLRSLLQHSFLDPIAALSAACILYAAAQGRSKFVYGVASMKGVAFLASLAYAVYLLHWLVLEGLFSGWLHGEVGNVAFVKLTIATVVLVLPISYVLNRFVEKPFLAIKDRQRGPSVTVKATRESAAVSAVTS